MVNNNAITQPNSRSRGRGWCFTRNHYDGTMFEDTVACKYICYGKEVAPTTGTPHLQGYVYWDNARSLASVRRLFTGCHITQARGSYIQNKEYCSKGGDFTERGDPPTTDLERGEMEKNRWANTMDLAKSGNLDQIEPELFIRYYTSLKRIAVDYSPEVESLESCCGLWIHGLSGSGKTFAIQSRFRGQLYPKPKNQWWCGYRDQPVVLFDDISIFHVKFGDDFKIWADRYSFIADKKGSSSTIRPKLFVVTSQYTIDQIWGDEETRSALKRRFKVIEKKENIDLVLGVEYTY